MTSTLPSSQTHQLLSSEPRLLRIPEKQFNEMYPDLVGLYDRFNNPPVFSSSSEFEQKYLSSKLWRLNNLYYVINKNGDRVLFRMNYAQHVVYSASRMHPRLIILKSRQQGISTLWLVSFFDDAMFCKFLNLGLMAQGTDEAATLLERTKFLWDNLDSSVKETLGIKLLKDNTKEYSFSNESTIFIRVSFRSTTLHRLHISEFGKIANQYPKRARETKTGSLQALGRGNTGVIESTAEGVNEFKVMWDKSVATSATESLSQKDFKPVFLSWLEDPDCNEDVYQIETEAAREYFSKLEEALDIELTQRQKNFWIVQYRELGDDVYQEYPATPSEAFSASKNGSYYSTLFTENVIEKNRLIANLYDRNLPVEIYFDIGIDDYMVMLFIQTYRGEIWFVDEYFNDGFGFSHYIDEAYDRGYDISAFKFPHDVEQRETTTMGAGGLARTRLDVVSKLIEEKCRQLSVEEPVVVKLKRSGIADGIEATRALIPKIRVDARCEYLIECFHKYSKDWDDTLKQWKKTPRHDEYSHGADTVRSVATDLSLSDMKTASQEQREEYNGEYNMGGFDV